MIEKSIRTTPGPIAQKFIRSAAKSAKNKIININDWRSAKSYQENLEKFHAEKDLSHLDPLHAIYMDMQHRIADFIELFSNFPESDKLNKIFEKAEDSYMPSGPPMSPITQSYFTCWSALDMCVGLKRETYASIMTDFCSVLGTPADFVRVLRCLQQSRMGLYIVQNNEDDFVYLREIYTNKVTKTHIPCKYRGLIGELWLVRLLPDPIGNYFDYSIAFTTPYIIVDFPLRKGAPRNFSALLYSENEWICFIERNLVRVKQKDKLQAYHHFMKYGLNKQYWLEYIFQAYVNHTPDMILLTGFPDRLESLPHAKDNYDNWVNEERQS